MLKELNMSEITIYELRDYLNKKKVENSLWEILYFVAKVNREYGSTEEEKIQFENLVNWLNRSKKEKQELSEEP